LLPALSEPHTPTCTLLYSNRDENNDGARTVVTVEDSVQERLHALSQLLSHFLDILTDCKHTVKVSKDWGVFRLTACFGLVLEEIFHARRQQA